MLQTPIKFYIKILGQATIFYTIQNLVHSWILEGTEKEKRDN